MRNLKRALSLGLASVMLLGMMVVGAGAKGIDDFTDKDKIVNKDAVAVTTEIGIFAGYDDGSFGGEKVVTRAEMAVIICKILYGSDVNVDQFAENNVFTDVPVWAAGYVNLCASLNIVAGVGDGKYDPSSTVTTSQAALMLAKALGYFQNEADYGNNWMLASTAKGTQIGLYNGLSGLSATVGLTRNDVALMVFNALTKAVPVAYNDVFGLYYSERGNLTAGVVFNYLDTLAFRNFDLVYKTKENADDFGRPGTVWGIGTIKTVVTSSSNRSTTDEKGNLVSDEVNLLAKNEIVAVTRDPDYIYTATTKQGAIYRNVGKDLATGSWEYYLDGKPQTAAPAPINDNDADYTYTAKGMVTELYVDGDDITMICVNYYLAEVDRVRNNADGTYITVSNPSGITIKTRDFYVEGFEEEDYAIITVAYDGKDNYVASAVAPETVEGEATAYSTKDNYVRLDGTKYDFSKNNEDDLDGKGPIKLGDDYKLYLDPNGYSAGFELAEASTAKYAFVKNLETSMGNYRARLVFADGSEEIVDVSNSSKNNASPAVSLENNAPINTFTNRIVTYTVSSKDVYSLTVVSASVGHYDIENDNRNFYPTGSSTAVSGARFNNDTIFVDMKNDKVYTDYEKVPSYVDAELAYAVEGASQVKVVFIVSGVPSGDKTFFYLTGSDSSFQKYDGDEYVVYEKSFIDGVQGDLWILRSVVTGSGTGNLNISDPSTIGRGLYEVTRIAADTYVKGAQVAAWSPVIVSERGNNYFTVGTGTSATDYDVDSDTVYVNVSADGKTVSTGKYSDVKKDALVVVVNVDGNTAELVYIVGK